MHINWVRFRTGGGEFGFCFSHCHFRRPSTVERAGLLLSFSLASAKLGKLKPRLNLEELQLVQVPIVVLNQTYPISPRFHSCDSCTWNMTLARELRTQAVVTVPPCAVFMEQHFSKRVKRLHLRSRLDDLLTHPPSLLPPS
jgi:hypothetical protein